MSSQTAYEIIGYAGSALVVEMFSSAVALDGFVASELGGLPTVFGAG
jgi:hypothetical protein